MYAIRSYYGGRRRVEGRLEVARYARVGRGLGTRLADGRHRARAELVRDFFPDLGVGRDLVERRGLEHESYNFV